jgi:hypothetical protein
MLADRGILREVAFTGSSETRVYASLYLPGTAEATEAVGVVICPSWGADVGLAVDATHRLAATLAENGVACALYHPPGHLDSTGDPEEVVMGDLVAAAVDCSELLRGRGRVGELRLVGIGLGASVAALAAARVRARSLVLVDPALDPAAFFAELQRSGRRAALGGGDGAAPFGHALPRALPGEEVAARVSGSLAALRDRVVAFRFASPTANPLPEGVQEVGVRGARTGRRWPHRFVEPVASFLMREAA